MREIKFKYGFSNGTDCFYKDFTLDEIEEGRPFDEISSNPLLRDYKIVSRSRYTRRKDKNGKKICEHDIVKFKVNDKYVIDDVFFSNGTFMVFDDDYNCVNLFSYVTNYDMEYDMEIIGNIYENPDLLKEEKQGTLIRCL